MVNIGDKRFTARNGAVPLGRMLTLIECPNTSLRYLILDCPTESTLDYYVEQFGQYDVDAVVRCCEPTYSAARLTELGIDVIDLPFKDGSAVSTLSRSQWGKRGRKA